MYFDGTMAIKTWFRNEIVVAWKALLSAIAESKKLYWYGVQIIKKYTILQIRYSEVESRVKMKNLSLNYKIDWFAPHMFKNYSYPLGTLLGRLSHWRFQIFVLRIYFYLVYYNMHTTTKSRLSYFLYISLIIPRYKILSVYDKN